MSTLHNKKPRMCWATWNLMYQRFQHISNWKTPRGFDCFHVFFLTSFARKYLGGDLTTSSRFMCMNGGNDSYPIDRFQEELTAMLVLMTHNKKLAMIIIETSLTWSVGVTRCKRISFYATNRKSN